MQTSESIFPGGLAAVDCSMRIPFIFYDPPMTVLRF
jgi:hypothetical protein